MTLDPIRPHEGEDELGLIDSFILDDQDDPHVHSPLYNYPQISAMVEEAFRLAHEDGMTLPRAIKRTAFRHATQAELLNRSADGSLDMSDEDFLDNVEDITQFFQQLIGYEMIHAERDTYRRRAQEREARARIRDFLRDERKNEPLFADIDRTMKTRYRSLPYGEAERIARAIEAFRRGRFNDSDISAMADYYERVRRELSAGELGADTSADVPAVERTGIGAPSAHRDYSELSKLSPREQTRWIARMLRGSY